MMAPSSDVRGATPDKVDMRDTLWPVEHVGEMAASAASAAAVALEYHCNRMGEEPTNLSSMFIHYNARLLTGGETANAGTTMEAVMKAITTHGACREVSWPLDPTRLAVAPPAHVYQEAAKFAAVRYSNPADAVEALALRYPVPVVVRLPGRSLREAGRTGVVPAPTSSELQTADGQINHALVLVGYDRTAKTFTARNCWGTAWGDQGHCAIPFDVMNVIAPYGTQRFWIITTAAAITGDDLSASSTPQPERLAGLAARMRQEIRGDLHRDIAEATKRIRDMVGRPSGARPPQPAPLDSCSACSGRGACWGCGGRGCNSCGGTGTCAKCGGRGSA
jgi:hypothetical protein